MSSKPTGLPDLSRLAPLSEAIKNLDLSKMLPLFQPMPDYKPTPLPEVSLEKAQEYASARSLIARLATRINWWIKNLPADQQPVVVAVLSNGLMIRATSLSAEGHNGVLIEGTTEQGPCMVLAHQANVQLLCFVETIPSGAVRRQIGFNVAWTPSSEQPGQQGNLASQLDPDA